MAKSPSISPLERTLRTLLGVVTTLALLAAVLYFAHYFYSLVALLGVVLILTYILLGPVNLLEYGLRRLSGWLGRWSFYRAMTRSPEANPRIVAVLAVFLVFLLLIVLGSVRFLPVLSHQVADLGKSATAHINRAASEIIDWADDHVGQGTVKKLFEDDIEQAQRQGKVTHPSTTGKPVTLEEKKVIQGSVLKSTLTHIERTLGSAVPSFVGLITSTLNSLVYFLAGLMLVFYFLVDGHKFKPAVLGLIPDAGVRNTLSGLLESFHQVMFAFIKGQVMLGILTGVYMTIVYQLFGVPYAFLLGVIFAIAELLPVIGTWIGIGIGLTVILLNMDPAVALWVWICSYLFQTVKDNILAPKVVGDVMGLHPLVIILSLVICAKLAGLVGILLALPLASMLNVLLQFMMQRDRLEKGREVTP